MVVILQVYGAIQTSAGWVLGEPFDSFETIKKRMKINIPDEEENTTEAIRVELEKEFDKWSEFGTHFIVELVIGSGADSIFSVCWRSEVIYCKCLPVSE